MRTVSGENTSPRTNERKKPGHARSACLSSSDRLSMRLLAERLVLRACRTFNPRSILVRVDRNVKAIHIAFSDTRFSFPRCCDEKLKSHLLEQLHRTT